MNLWAKVSVKLAAEGAESSILGLHHAARLMFTAPSLAQHSVDLVDKDNTRLQLPRQTEDSVDQLVAVAIPLLGEGGDVQVDEAGARLVCEGLCQHGLSAARGAVQKHTAGGAQQRRRVRVEVRHCERVDDRLLELFDDRVQAANVVKRHWDLLGRDDLHGDGLLVAVQDQLLHARAPAPWAVPVVFTVVLAVAFAPFAGENGVEFAGCGGGLGACLFLLLGVGVEAGKQVADDEVGYEGLAGLLVRAVA